LLRRKFVAASNASWSLDAFEPPACARSGRPPPPPPTTRAAWLMMSFALSPASTRSLERPTTSATFPPSWEASTHTSLLLFLRSTSAALRSSACEPGSFAVISFTPLMSFACSSRLPEAMYLTASWRCLVTSFCRDRICWSNCPQRFVRFSSCVLRMSQTCRIVSSFWRSRSRVFHPVTASMRRTPPATLLSLVMRKRPISPVRWQWVPPHSSRL